MNFYSYNFGCRVNQAELEKINREFTSQGFIYNQKNPDFIVINSCAVTQKAERQVRQLIYQLTRKHPRAKIYLTGCAATFWYNSPSSYRTISRLSDRSGIHSSSASLRNPKLSRRISGIHSSSASFRNPERIRRISGIHKNKNIQIIPNFQKQNLINIISKDYQINSYHDVNNYQDISKNQRIIQHLSAYKKSGRLLVKIQDGCHCFCSYCIVPYLRGKPKSKTIKEIINEINSYCFNGLYPAKAPFASARLEASGAKKAMCGAPQKIQEIILTAINTEDYHDTSFCHSGESRNLYNNSIINLIKTILSQTNIPRVSFGSINPRSLTDEFLKFYSSLSFRNSEQERGISGIHSSSASFRNPKRSRRISGIYKNRLVHFFHIPIQSGSDKILKLMNRGYKAENILIKLQKIHSINPQALIATDIIVGFPGETEKDFQETFGFIKNSPISKVHIFPFSKREGTKAFQMAKTLGEINPEIMKKRIKSLKTLNSQKYSSFQKTFLDKTFPVLFLEKRVGGYQEALLNNQIPILVKTKKDLKGEIKEVQIQNFQNEKLFGIIKSYYLMA